MEPPNPSYVREGTNATLVWQYSVDDKQAELQGVVFSVLDSTIFAGMIAKTKDGVVLSLPSIPSAYKGRVSFVGNATLIINNVSTPQDNTQFQCILSAEPGAGRDQWSIVQLIVAGKYCKMFVKEKKLNILLNKEYLRYTYYALYLFLGYHFYRTYSIERPASNKHPPRAYPVDSITVIQPS